MKSSVVRFVEIYVLFVVVFIVERLLFIGYYHNLFHDADFSEIMAAVGHGLPLDLSIAGYLTAVPGLLIMAQSFTEQRNKIVQGIGIGYFSVAALALSVIFIVDAALYSFWGFRLDMTPIFYFTTSPKDAFASVGIGYVLLGFAAIIVWAILLFLAFRYVFSQHFSNDDTPKRWQKKTLSAVGMLVLTALLFIPIRGGFSVSTMNLSVAYFSQNQRLNHAAINPAFSLMYSATHQSNFDKQYRFMDNDRASQLMETMVDKPAVVDSIPQLLSTKRPDIVFIILESFSAHLLKTLGGEDIAVNINNAANDGLLFTNFYANSFRTDRGLVSIISGYPAQPSTSIMKYAEKVENLPSIPKSLKQNGYDLAYYYGGDTNFTNMFAYLVSCGFEKVISDKDFPLSQRTGKWGANDGTLFDRFIKDFFEEKPTSPRLCVVQTSSSHEPFDVPYHKLTNKAANAFSYADSCAGSFIDKLKASPRWGNTLVVLVPDHYGVYPPLDDMQARHHSFLVMTGGALKLKGKVEDYASQIDIAATLLYQMGIDHSNFVFSKNILNPASPHFGYFTEPSVLGMVTPENTFIYNCDANSEMQDTGTHKGSNKEKGMAFLQKLYDDLAKR